MTLNHRGIALMMVMTGILILTAFLVDFTFDTKIHKLKVYTFTAKTQAKLTAQSGFELALICLVIF